MSSEIMDFSYCVEVSRGAMRFYAITNCMGSTAAKLAVPELCMEIRRWDLVDYDEYPDGNGREAKAVYESTESENDGKTMSRPISLGEAAKRAAGFNINSRSSDVVSAEVKAGKDSRVLVAGMALDAATERLVNEHMGMRELGKDFNMDDFVNDVEKDLAALVDENRQNNS